MSAAVRLRVQAGVLSVLILLAILAIWHVSTSTGTAATAAGLTPAEIEYQKMLGKDPAAAASKNGGFPTLSQMAATIAQNLAHPFYDNGPNDKGIGIQIGWSLLRVGLGFGLAALVAIPLGFLIGMSPLVYRALDPFIQVLKPISPLAWMPIALYTIKDSSISGIFVIFICSIWPMLVNTAFGVANVRREWLAVARTLEVTPMRKAFRVILPPRRRPSSPACGSRWASRGW